MINDSFNDLEHLQFLNLSKNKIETFHISTVSNLRNIKTLDLSENCLHNDSYSISKHSWSLLELRIHHNMYDAYPEDFISTIPSLQTLYLDVFEGFKFGSGFFELQNLSEIHFYPRNSFQLQNDSFYGLRNAKIESLEMDFSFFVYNVETDVFSPFSHLKELTLNIGERCNIRKALKALYGLRGRQMEYLNLANNFLNAARPIQLTDQDISFLKTMCIKRVDLRRNTIFRIPFSIADSRFANCLEEIRIGENKFQDSDFLPLLFMLSYKNIRTIDCSYPVTYIQSVRPGKNNRISNSNLKLNFTLTFAESLRTFNMAGANQVSHRLTNNMHVVGKKLEVFNLAYTQWDWCRLGFHITFNTNIKYLNLTNWDCGYLNPKFLRSITTLETLIFRDAGLSGGLKWYDPDGTFLQGLVNLSTLDLAGNDLTSLHNNLFSDQSFSLRHLSLQNNIFRQIPLAVRRTQNLKLLNIQNNKLSELSKSDTQILDECSDAQVHMSMNPFVCSCDNLHMIQWLEKNKKRILDFDDLKCTSGETVKSQTELIRQFELKCLGTFWLEFSSSMCIAMIIAIIVFAICYRYRVYIEYMYLILVSFKPNREHAKDEFEFDGFISYSAKDTDWVTQVLYKRLTDEIKMKVCIHHKDFIPGRTIANEILRCIDESRKIIFVVTRNFLESDWGNYELEMARIHAFRSGRSGLLLILKDELSIDEMPDVLKRMWWKIVCMKWPTDELSEERLLFWHNLK